MSRFDARFNTLSAPEIITVGATAAKAFSNSNRRVFRILNTKAAQTLAVGWDNTVDVADATTYVSLLATDEAIEIYGYTGEVWVVASGTSNDFEGFEGTHTEISGT